MIKQQPIQQVLHFFSAGSQFCIDLSSVAKVFPIVLFQYVPEGPAYLRGLMTLGGKSVPVIDLAIRLGEKNPNQYTVDTPIVLCTDGHRQVGLIVDQVAGVEKVEEKDLQMRPMFKKDSKPPFKAVVGTPRGLSLLLDMERVLDIDLSAVKSGKARERRHSSR